MGDVLPMPQPRSGVLDIAAYVPGRSKAAPGVKLYKLSSNESPLGPSEKARQAYLDIAARLEDYPDGGSTELREAIGAVHGLNPANIVCGNGSDDLLSLIAHAYLEPGDEAIFSDHAFLVYRIDTLASGGVPVSVPEKNLTVDVDAMLAKVSERTKLVFLANPNNPTGSYIPYSEVKRLHAGLRDDILLVLDGAYAEFVHTEDYSAGLDMARDEPNVLMTRTFSKIYGLAGLRLGWAYGPESVIDAIHRVRGPFNVTSVAQAAGIAALSDDSFVDASIAHNTVELKRLKPLLEGMGYTVYPSVCNFFLIDFGSEERADAADRFLRSKGIVIRDMKAYGLPTCMRLSIGTTEADNDVLEAFDAFSKAH